VALARHRDATHWHCPVPALQLGLGLLAGLGVATDAPFRSLLFNNAASLGGMCHVDTPAQSFAEFREGMDFNITSALWIFRRFTAFAKVHGAAAPWAATSPSVAVNVSSISAVLPSASGANYCAGEGVGSF